MDNNIKSFEEFNESWRQWKFRLGLPIYILNGLLSRLLNMEANINLHYKSLAAKVDMGQSVNTSGYEIKEEPIKLTLDKFKNTKLYYQLKSSGFFTKWNVYHIGNINKNGNRSDEGKARIFITKDELKKGDEYTGRRINDRYISSDKLDFIVIIAAKITDEHDEINVERKFRKDKQISKDINKLFKIAIKNGTYNTTGKVDYHTRMSILYAVVKYNKPILLKKLIEIIPEDKRKYIFSEKKYYTSFQHGEPVRNNYDSERSSSTLFDIAKGKVKAMLVKYQDKKTLAKKYNFKDKASDAFKKFNS